MSFVFVAGCSDDGGTINSQEVISNVTLTFRPASGNAVVAVWNDPDGDGGAAPTIDTIGLQAGSVYTLEVAFKNTLESPPEDITVEIADEATEHQVFFTGSAVSGPASASVGAAVSHSYADVDVNGLPIGLHNSVQVGAGAAGELTVTLRHLPPVNGTATKTATLATMVRDGGFAAIGGETDAQVTFPVAIAVP
jgi:hypothetical protein